MTQFIAYHVGDSHDDAIPVATGRTRDDAMALGIRRILSRAITFGGLSVQEREDVSADTFTTLTAILGEHFKDANAL